MGIFSRLSDIIAANLNSLLDKAENPQVMIAQIIREMEDGLAAAKRYGATAIAAERRLARELEQNRSQAEFWKARAREALAADREPLARRALARKKEHDDLVRSLETQYSSALQTSEHVRTSLRALEARLAEARRKQRSLLARNQAAKARLELHRALASGIGNFATPHAKFERLENRLLDFEDELVAQTEIHQALGALEGEFADLERDQAIEVEMEALRKEQGGN